MESKLTGNEHVKRMAEKLGISPAQVTRAINNLLYGDGAVYRRMIANPLHGCGK